METTETEKENKEKVVMDIMVTEKAMAIMVAEKAIMAVMEKTAAIMEEKATKVASDSIIAHPIAIGTT